MRQLGNLENQINNYRFLFEAFNELFPIDPEIKSIKGQVTLEKATGEVIMDTKATIVITREGPDSDIIVKVGLDVKGDNFVSMSETILPNLNRARPSDMTDIAGNGVIVKIAQQIQSYDAVRVSFDPSRRK